MARLLKHIHLSYIFALSARENFNLKTSNTAKMEKGFFARIAIAKMLKIQQRKRLRI